MHFFSKNDWKKYQTGVILLFLFGALCVFSAENADSKPDTLSSISEQTAKKLAQYRKKTAEQELLIKQLKAEIVRLRTENIQKKSEDAQKGTAGGTAESVVPLRNQKEVRSELFDTLKRIEIQSEKQELLTLSAASVFEKMTPLTMSEREKELLQDLKWIRDHGCRTAGKTADLCDRILKLLPKMKLDAVESASLRVSAEELIGLNGTFAKLLEPPKEPKKFKTCRVLETDPEAGFVILDAGYRDGIRQNMKLRTGERGSVELRVIVLRPFVSAAAVDKSQINNVGIGMTVDTGK